MRVFSKTLSRLIRIVRRQPCKKNLKAQQPATIRALPDIATPITRSLRSVTAKDIPDEDVAALVSRLGFILADERLPVEAKDQWWNEQMHHDRVRIGSPETYAWMEPFVPVELAGREQLHGVTKDWGPLHAVALAKALRERIGACRMHKQSHEQLLRALYGACLMADFIQALRIEGRQPCEMIRHVDINELRAVKIDYASVGYQCIESLGETDRKWLIEAFGEPVGHQSCEVAFATPWRDAVSRFYWSEYRAARSVGKRSFDLPFQTMQGWLHERVRRTFACYRDRRQRLADFVTWDTEARCALGAAWLASTKSFIVAGIGTTGLNDKIGEVIEIAAIRVSPAGEAMEEFSMRIKPQEGSPATGVRHSQLDALDRARCVADEAMTSFLRFVGTEPVFLHNVPYCRRLLRKAIERTGKRFGNPLHDTVPLARAAWPELGAYSLTELAPRIGAAETSAGAAANAKATLAVLFAARKAAASMQFYGGIYPSPRLCRAPAPDYFPALPLSGEHAA